MARPAWEQIAAQRDTCAHDKQDSKAPSELCDDWAAMLAAGDQARRHPALEPQGHHQVLNNHGQIGEAHDAYRCLTCGTRWRCEVPLMQSRASGAVVRLMTAPAIDAG